MWLVCGERTLERCACACHGTGLDNATTDTIRKVWSSFGIIASLLTTIYIQEPSEADVNCTCDSEGEDQEATGNDNPLGCG